MDKTPAHFVRLTYMHANGPSYYRPVWVNPAHVSLVEPPDYGKVGSTIRVDGKVVFVVESAEDVIRVLNAPHS